MTTAPTVDPYVWCSEHSMHTRTESDAMLALGAEMHTDEMGTVHSRPVVSLPPYCFTFAVTLYIALHTLAPTLSPSHPLHGAHKST